MNKNRKIGKKKFREWKSWEKVHSHEQITYQGNMTGASSSRAISWDLEHHDGTNRTHSQQRFSRSVSHYHDLDTPNDDSDVGIWPCKRARNEVGEQVRSKTTDLNQGWNRSVNKNRDSPFGTSKNEFSYTMNIRELYALIKETPSNIILTLVEEKSGFTELLNQKEMSGDVVILLTKLLSTALMSKLHKANQNHLMTILLTSNFFSLHLPKFLSKNENKSDFDDDLFSNIGNICHIIMQKMPHSAGENLQLCVSTYEQAMGIYEQSKSTVPPDVKKLYKSIEDTFLEMSEMQIVEHNQQEIMKQSVFLDDEEFHDFQKIPIIPSIDEITSDEKPLLRRIVTKGSYKNVNHYLDTHFRLLREDFIYPLRRGIVEYLSKSSSENTTKKQELKDIRVYKNVTFLEPSFESGGVSYVIKLNDSSNKKFRWEMSKRLMFGSLVCFSADNFRTTLFATVANREIEDLKRGELSVAFEDQSETQNRLTPIKLRLSYTMVESQAYYESYKHVLLALQKTDAKTLPLQNYIINVQQTVEPPRYLQDETIYDMSCILSGGTTSPAVQWGGSPSRYLPWYLPTSPSYSPTSPSYSPTSPSYSTSPHLPALLKHSSGSVRSCTMSPIDNSQPSPCNSGIEDCTFDAPDEKKCTLAKIQVQNLITWPSSEELSLDNAQRKALHLALTSAMAIIQGPPGTGKTYLGLKIAKVLLHNRRVWRKGDNSGPILVICYTNHALDQFLDGMLTFTKRLVRVGSRSKCEELQRFNIRNIRQQLRINKAQAKNIFYNLRHMRQELRAIRGKWEELKENLKMFRRKIIHEASLHRLNEFGEEFRCHLVRDFEDYYMHNSIDQQQWEPDSFILAWLGLDLYGWVDETEIENFMSECTAEDQLIDCEIIFNDDNADDNEINLEDLVDIEDDETVEESRRILDTELTEDLSPINYTTQNLIWGLDVETCDDPSQLLHEEDFEDRDMFKIFCLKAKTRQNIAVRELQKNHYMDEDEAKVRMQANLWTMSLDNRWHLYRLLIRKFVQLAENEQKLLQDRFTVIAKQMREVENGEELAIFTENDVIGMTTTGAAKYHGVLQALNPTIVIVEEAAEVLESHIVTSLASGTQHLILIGDHQQLKPKPTVYTLGKDYHLDLSLFERMINNGVHYETLKIQHRMRPEISRLLVPLLYKSLEDHPSVREYPAIKGTACSMYFINHSVKEDVVDDTKSHSNKFEAEYLVAFCRYLLQQGYSPDKITILTTYVAQLYTFRNLMKRKIFCGVRVLSVDNFQGEENDIILLSFVRSNADGNIGFLNIENRVNVALSRARHGMFCIGNFRLYAEKCKLWHHLVSTLELYSSIGEGVEIVCQKHSSSVFKIVNPADFQKFAPEGGCLELCNEPLPCQHNCDLVCHLHERHGICHQPCVKKCELGHTCPLSCSTKCKPCVVSVRKTFLNCEHSICIPCHQDISTVKCSVEVERILKKCQHTNVLECHVDPETYKCKVVVKRELSCKHTKSMNCHVNPAEVVCSEPCRWRLDDCGHQCPKACHIFKDPGHLDIQCSKPCAKYVCSRNHRCKMLCYQECNTCCVVVKKDLPCGHSAEMECHMSPSSYICSDNCTRLLPCGHICPKKCNEVCGDCDEVVVKKLPHCSHSIPVSCSHVLDTVMCPETCNRPLPCGHPCPGKCCELCNSTVKCTIIVNIKADCGHNIEVPCHMKAIPEIVNRYCSYPCNKILPHCEHVCGGTCGECRQGRVHVPCKEKCGRTLVCGHVCTYPCGQWCPPCKEKCHNMCNHSRCFKKCGEPCVMCNEPCSWKCEHEKCNNYCGELCDREPCDKSCPKYLSCGHPCIGLCGESCPPLCRKCNFEELTEFILSGNETNEDARFVYLSDCQHTIEVESMDHWMKIKDTETADMSIQMKCCPRCRTAVWECSRYGNLIKTTFMDVQKVKEKLFGSKQNQRREMTKLLNVLKTNTCILRYFKVYYDLLQGKLEGICNLHQSSTAVIENQINILRRMAELKEKFAEKKLCKEAITFADDDFEFLIQRLFLNNERISHSELTQIIMEIDRITLYAQMLNVENQSKVAIGWRLNTEQHLDQARRIFAIGNILDDEQSKTIKAHLEAASIRKGLGISNAERIMIVQAMQLKAGHWYKCSNGHVYAIGECGGANQVSRCNECGEQIGGQNHQLVSSNAHAGEMDGSRHPAWSEAANLANYAGNGGVGNV